MNKKQEIVFLKNCSVRGEKLTYIVKRVPRFGLTLKFLYLLVGTTDLVQCFEN